MTAPNSLWQRQWKGMAIAGTVTLAAMMAGCAAPASAPAPASAVPDPGPQGGRGTPEGCQADKLGDDALIGKTEAEAAALLKGCA